MLIAVNESGRRIGEDHPNATLTDRDIELIRHLHEVEKMSYSALATKFDVSKMAICLYCTYQRRAQTIAGWREVAV